MSKNMSTIKYTKKKKKILYTLGRIVVSFTACLLSKKKNTGQVPKIKKMWNLNNPVHYFNCFHFKPNKDNLKKSPKKEKKI